jgi:hypothetical protein
MCSCFAPDDHDFPYWQVDARPEAFLARPMEQENPGRHLPPLLMARRYAGIPVAEECVAKHAGAALFSYGQGPLPLNLRRAVDGDHNVVDKESRPVDMVVHNNREGLHALWALTEFRGSERARELAEAHIATVMEYWDPVSDWDYERMEREHGVGSVRPRTFIHGLARAIGPLARFYRSTGHAPALELATALKDRAIGEFFLEDGGHDPLRFGTHSHSTTSVMSSLALLADVTRDHGLMDRVKRFYDNGLWDLRDQLGWSPEYSGSEKYSDRGEINNTGDILETALVLGRWGHTQCYHDAERILRCHLLPSQLRDASWVHDPPNPDGVDGRSNVAGRLVGTWGFPAPYGHQPIDFARVSFNLDIVGGGALALCEAFRELSRHDDSGHRVNLLFDHETPAIKVESRYTHPTLNVVPKRPGSLAVRMPPWVDLGSLRVNGAADSPDFVNGYVQFSHVLADRPITFSYPLPAHEMALDHRGKRIRARLRGDEVDAMENFGADLTFFDPLV